MSQKKCLLALFFLGVFSLCFAYFFMQLFLGLVPCPLCIIDRYVVGFIAVSSFLGWLFYPKARFVALFVVFVSLIAGLITTVRHVYLEWFPFQSSSCMFGGDENTLVKFFIDAFAGKSDCTLVDWRFLGVSLAEMTLALMVFLTVFFIYTVFFSKKDIT